MAQREQLSQLFWQHFLTEQRLPDDYRWQAEKWFVPLLVNIATMGEQRAEPLLVSIHGAQGSGKSTLAQWLALALPEWAGLTACAVSLDDFYCTKDRRQALAHSVHPLLATRGVPGTHDCDLMAETLHRLRYDDGPVPLPVFDKALDDRIERRDWRTVQAPVDIVIWEGWCLGVPPQPAASLVEPVNALESEQDPNGVWRHYVNERLAAEYAPLFAAVDLQVMLAAPGFDCVYQWRLEQEQKLAARRGSQAAGIMTAPQIAAFIQFYQRLTEWGLAVLPERVDCCYRLDHARSIVGIDGVGSVSPI